MATDAGGGRKLRPLVTGRRKRTGLEFVGVQSKCVSVAASAISEFDRGNEASEIGSIQGGG